MCFLENSCSKAIHLIYLFVLFHFDLNSQCLNINNLNDLNTNETMLEKNFALTLSSFYYNFKKLLQLQTALTKIVYFKVF